MASRSVMSLSKSLHRFRSLPLLAAAPPPPPLRRLSSPSPSPSTSLSPPPPSPAAATSSWKPYTRCLIVPDEDTDYKHWIVTMKPPDPHTSPDQLKQSFTTTLAQVLGSYALPLFWVLRPYLPCYSEDEAKEKIYSMSLNHIIAFGARISEELSNKIAEHPNVERVIPDSYVDEENNVFGILDIAYRDDEWERDHQRSRECFLAERMIRRIRSKEKYKHRAGNMRWYS